MKFITLIAALAAVPAAFGLTINTPANVVQCEPTQFTWSDGTAPFYLSLTPAGQPSAPAIKEFAPQTGDSYTWLVDLAQGTSFTAVLKDGTGASQATSIITIVAGTSSSCLNNTVEETGSSNSGAASTGSGSTASSTSAAAASSSTSTHSGAGQLSVSPAFGVAGIMGLLGAVLF